MHHMHHMHQIIISERRAASDTVSALRVQHVHNDHLQSRIAPDDPYNSSTPTTSKFDSNDASLTLRSAAAVDASVENEKLLGHRHRYLLDCRYPTFTLKTH